MLLQSPRASTSMLARDDHNKHYNRFSPSIQTRALESDARTPSTYISSLYSFGPFFLLASFSWSLNNLRKILPLGDLGTTSMNSTPPFSHLCLLLCCSTCFTISRAIMRSFSSMPISDDLTTKALGTSPAESSGTGMTAQSATCGCVRRCASNSAGATWSPFVV